VGITAAESEGEDPSANSQTTGLAAVGETDDGGAFSTSLTTACISTNPAVDCDGDDDDN